MSKRELIISNLEACWSSCTDLFGSLADEQWDVQSLCPEWTVKGVAAHMVSVEQVLSDWLPSGLDAPPPFQDVPGHVSAALAMSADELVAHMRATFDTRLANLAETTDEVFASPSVTPVGPATYERFMAVREFDFWMHERDCRTPLGTPDAARMSGTWISSGCSST